MYVYVISVLFFIAQMILCFKVKRLWIRLIPTLPTFVLTVIFSILIFVSEGWDAIGFLLLAIITGGPLAGCVLAWFIWAIYKICKRKKLP